MASRTPPEVITELRAWNKSEHHCLWPQSKENEFKSLSSYTQFIYQKELLHITKINIFNYQYIIYPFNLLTKNVSECKTPVFQMFSKLILRDLGIMVKVLEHFVRGMEVL